MLVELARNVDRERFAVSCCYLLPWKDHLAGELEAAGVTARCLGVTRDLDPSWTRRLRAAARQHDADVVHAHLPTAGIGARIAMRRERPRRALAYTEHNTWDRYRPATRLLNAWTFGLQDAVVAVSEEVARSMRARRMPPVRVIPNGVDLARLRGGALGRDEARRELGLPGDAFVVGTVGGLTPKKGHAILATAARGVVEAHPGVVFAFVGLPIDEGPVRRAIVDGALEGRVLLAGYRAEAARLMPAFDAYCLPSLHEGMPVSLLEAMALGLPAVATRVGGVPEVVTDGEDALLVPPGDPGALAAALSRLAADGDLRDRLSRGARRAAERFSIGTTARSTERLYLDLVGAP
jgi:glycosyltransferase involved in cell wall biosynthesis